MNQKQHSSMIPIFILFLIAIFVVGTYFVTVRSPKTTGVDKTSVGKQDAGNTEKMQGYSPVKHESIDKEMQMDHWDPLYVYEPFDEEKIKASKELSEELKAKLIKANREAKVHFDTIKEITKANDKIFEEVMDGSADEYLELNRIYERHADIRQRFEQEEIDRLVEDSALSSLVHSSEEENERIRNSKVLSEEEKKLLIADNEESETYQKKIDARYAIYRERSAENNDKYNAAYLEIEKIYAANNIDVNEIPYDIIVPQTENLQ